MPSDKTCYKIISGIVVAIIFIMILAESIIGISMAKQIYSDPDDYSKHNCIIGLNITVILVYFFFTANIFYSIYDK